MLKKKQKNKDVDAIIDDITIYSDFGNRRISCCSSLKVKFKNKNLFSFAVVLWELMPRINENYVLIKKKNTVKNLN